MPEGVRNSSCPPTCKSDPTHSPYSKGKGKKDKQHLNQGYSTSAFAQRAPKGAASIGDKPSDPPGLSVISEESWLTDPTNTTNSSNWKIRDDVTADAEIPGASPTTRDGLPQRTLCKLCHRVGHWRMMALLKEKPDLKKQGKFPYEWFKVDAATTALNLTDKKSVDDRFDPSKVYEVCIDCCGSGFHGDKAHYWTTDKANPSDWVPTSGWRTAMFESRFSGPIDKALKKFDKMIAKLEEELSNQRMNPDFKKRKEHTLALVRKLHAECNAFTPFTDWVTRLTSYQLKDGIYILYGRKGGINWRTVLLDDANYVKLSQVFVPDNKEFFEGTKMPTQLSSPRSPTDVAAVNKLAEFLRPYGAYTVCSADWFLERPASRNMDVYTSWPTSDDPDDQEKDTWIFPIDGSQFDHKTMYDERLVCFNMNGVMEFATVGALDDLTRNELELMRKLVLAEVFDNLHINGEQAKMDALTSWITKPAGIQAHLDCLSWMRKKDTQIFRQQAKNCIHLNSTTMENIQQRYQSGPHKLICKHPELSLQTTGTPCPMVVVNLEGTQPLGNRGVEAMTAVCLKASGLPLEQLQESSAKMIASEFNLQQYGKGTHNTFKRMLVRATTESCSIETWFSAYLHSLPEDAEITEYPTHEEYQQAVAASGRREV